MVVGLDVNACVLRAFAIFLDYHLRMFGGTGCVLFVCLSRPSARLVVVLGVMCRYVRERFP